MVYREPMGVEPADGVGLSVSADSPAHICIGSGWVPHRCSGATPAAESTGVDVSSSCDTNASLGTADVILSRAQRVHSPLSWEERLARNARPPTAGHGTIKLFGIPATFAASLGLATA